MQSHLNVVQLRAQTIDLITQMAVVVTVTITPVDAIHVSRDAIDFPAQSGTCAVTTQLPAHMREHSIQPLDASIQVVPSDGDVAGVIFVTIIVSERRNAA